MFEVSVTLDVQVIYYCSFFQRRVLDFTQYEMEKKALEAFGDLGEDEELGPTDWPTVKRYIKSLSISGERIHPHDASESSEIGGYLDLMNLKDMRVRLLNGTEFCFTLPYTSIPLTLH